MSDKKKLLLAIDNLKIGGIQKNMVNLLNELCDIYDITLFVFYASGEYMNQIPQNVKIIEAKSAFRLLGMSQKEACKKISTAIGRTFFWFIVKVFGNKIMYSLMLKTQKNIGEFDYAISGMQSTRARVFFSGCNELILGRVKAKEKIAYIHCDYVQSGIDNEYNRSIYRKLDKVLVPNLSNRNQLLKVIPDIEKKVFIVNNFCDYKSVEKSSEIDTVKYDKSTINIVTVARITPEKGIARAVKVMSDLKNSGYNITYHVVGGGENYDDVCNYVNENNLSDFVFLHGYDTNPYKYIKNADMFLLPSIHEAAGLVIDEARSLGVPVLSTETVAAKEVIEQHNCGWVCKNSDEGLYEGIKMLLDDIDVVREKAHELASIKCNNDHVKKQFDDMLKKEI